MKTCIISSIALLLTQLGAVYGTASYTIGINSPGTPHRSTQTTLLSTSTTNSSSIDSKPQQYTTPQRGIDLCYPIDPQELFQAFSELQSDYQSKAFDQQHEWRLLHRQDGVQVAIMEHPEDPTCPYIRMKGIFPFSVQDCWDFLCLSNWDYAMPKMDPFYEGVSLHGEYMYENVTMTLCRKRTTRLFAFGKRDLVFLSVANEPLPDGTRISGTVAVKSDLLPRQSGYVRAFQDSIAFYKPIEGNTKTELTIMCRIDLNDSSKDGTGGFVPMWMYVRTIGKSGALSIIRMRNALQEEKG